LYILIANDQITCCSPPAMAISCQNKQIRPSDIFGVMTSSFFVSLLLFPHCFTYKNYVFSSNSRCQWSKNILRPPSDGYFWLEQAYCAEKHVRRDYIIIPQVKIFVTYIICFSEMPWLLLTYVTQLIIVLVCFLFSSEATNEPMKIFWHMAAIM